MTDAQVRRRLHDAIDKAGGVRAFARAHNLSAAYVSDVRLSNRAIGPRIAKALGYRVKVTRIVTREYVRIQSASLRES